MHGSGRRLLLRAAVAGLVIVTGVAGTVATAALTGLEERLPPAIAGALQPEVEPAPVDRQTFLIIGSDKRFGDTAPSRSDTVMLVRMDTDRDANAVLSLPRDLAVDIPGHGRGRLNAAYSAGGEKLLVRTLKRLFGEDFPIHHVVNVNFGGFRRAITQLGCVYVDVDRRYFHSNAGLPQSQHYAEIDLQPGYQRLCGQKALDFARHRHSDNDLVRAARQQEVLRALKDQMSTSSLLDNRDELLDIFADATRTDANLASAKGALRSIKLAAFSAGKPVVRIPFPAAIGEGEFVEASREQVRRAADRLLAAGDTPRRNSGSDPTSQRDSGSDPESQGAAKAHLAASGTAMEDAAARLATSGRIRMPVAFPARLTRQGRLVDSRAYSVRDRAGRRHDAYRFVVVHNQLEGEFYGVQGTTWRRPPLLAHPSSKVRMRGRTYELFRDGNRIRHVAWRTRGGTYWVSNTLTSTLSRAEMLGIAASLRRFS